MRNIWTHTASTYTLMRTQELKKRPQRNGRKRLVICSLENKTEITEKVKEALQKCGASFFNHLRMYKEYNRPFLK